jgi:hypothetical protein
MFAMTWPPWGRGIGGWRGRLLAATFLALLAAAGAARVAAAQDDPYSTTVSVDATSDSAAKARDLARIDGQRRALNTIVDRLAGGPGKAKPPKLSDNQITDMVTSFEVANEKMSAVRYVADYTYHFRADALTKALQAAGVTITAPNPANPGAPAADAGGKPIVVLPVYQSGGRTVLWEDPNPWRQAWAERQPGSGPSGNAQSANATARLLVPMGDIGDMGAIDADKARAGDSAAFTEIAKKYAADEALLMVAVQRSVGDRTGGERPAGLDVTVRRYRLGQPGETHADSIDSNPGEAENAFFGRAVAQIVIDIDNGWKSAKTPRVDQQGSIVAVLPISGLDDWIKLRDRLTAVPAVRKVEVRSLSRQEATIEIQYVGSLDQFKGSLADIKLALEGGDPTWRIARSAEAKP